MLYTSRVSDSQHTAAKKFNFYTRLEYYARLIEHIKQTKSGDRIAIATLAFEPSEIHINQVMEALCAAAQRGVAVRCIVDAISFTLVKGRIPGPLLYGKKIDILALPLYARKRAALEKLAACGGEYTVTNPPRRLFSNPFANRSHIKFAVINNEVYTGGCNLKEADRSDIMVQWQDNNVADWLIEFAANVHEKNNVRRVLKNTDTAMPVDKQTQLLIDAGVKNQSLIFRHALQLIDDAQEYIVMTCQYFPNDVTAKKLSQAIKRGVDVRLIYNHPSKHSFPLSWLHYAVKYIEQRKYQPALFKNELSKRRNYMHAKLLVSEKACIVGSHNYVRAGVRFGTAEIALTSSDPVFATYALAALDRQV